MAFPGLLSRNPGKFFTPFTLLAPATRAASTNGLTLDRTINGGYEALCILLMPGTWTDGVHTVICEESDDNSTWSTVNASDLLGGNAFASITSGGTAILQKLDYIGRKRYVRVRTTVTSATTGAVLGVLGLLFSPTIYPAV